MLEILQTLGTILATFAAGIFFLMKVASGYLVTNAHAELRLDRRSSGDGEDLLVVEVTVVKGDRGTLRLHDVQALVRCGDDERAIELPGVRRLSFRTERTEVEPGVEHAFLRVLWDRTSKSAPHLNLTPGERATFATCCSVPEGQAVEVEAVVLGRTLVREKVGQWHAAAVAPPC